MDASAVFINGTHIKANANKKKSQPAEVEVQAKSYQKQLDEEITKDRELHGKKPLKNGSSNDDDQPPTPPATKTISQSKTDPECGLFHKGEHEKQFAYVANTACDKHNFILDFGLYEKVLKKFPEMQAIAVDAGYKTPAIMKQIIDSEKIPCVPYKRPMTKDGFFKKHDFVYDEYFDCVLCPNNQALSYSTTDRDGYPMDDFLQSLELGHTVAACKCFFGRLL